MRNLKKILALVLALVMSLSLMATAGAADAAATSSETVTPAYEIALQVLGKDGLKVFGGYTDGTIRPQNNITRAEVAAILYRIVTGDVTDAQAGIYTDMANVNFNDLTGANWAKGYINYCANAQLIVGVGGNQFKPLANITGYATLAMILRALGYDKNGEFKGSGWEIRTASKARELGILKNVSENLLGSAATRELVAELLFRAMLCDKVTYNALTQDYDKTGVTLGYSVFTLEEVKGVVVANEYADIRDKRNTPAADDTTVLRDSEGKDRTVNYASGLDDLGETRVAYTIENGKRDQYDLKNVKLENPGVDSIAYDGGEEKTAAQVTALIGRTDDNTKHLINFGESADRTDTTIKVTYVATAIVERISARTTAEAIDRFFEMYPFLDKVAAAANVTAALAPTSYVGGGLYDVTYRPSTVGTGDFVAQRSWAAGHTYSVVNNVNGATLFLKVEIAPNSVFNAADDRIVTSIFNQADLVNGGTLIEQGAVYRGTQTLHDYSDWRSYEAFLEDCFDIDEDTTRVTTNGKGYWLKVIDNDNDGVTDWVFQTRYTVASVQSVNDSGVPTLETEGTWGAPDAMNVITGSVVAEETVEANDVVYYAVLDGVARVWKAEAVDVRVDSVNRNKLEVTVEGNSTPYEESANHEHSTRIEIGSGVTRLAGKTNYTFYLDKFGYLAAYAQNAKGNFTVLTDGWFHSLKNGAEYAVQAWDVDAKAIAQYDVTSGGNLFVDNDINDGSNSWGRIRKFNQVNCNTPAANPDTDDVHTIAAYIEADGETATLLPVDMVYDTQRVENGRNVELIDMNKTIPGNGITRSANPGIYSTLRNAAGSTYANPVAGDVEVRALSNTMYYYVYHTVPGNTASTVVKAFEGYAAGTAFLTDHEKTHIEDVYVVGTRATHIDATNGNATLNNAYYTANVVVIELDDEYYLNKHDQDEIFIYDFEVVSDRVNLETVQAIGPDGKPTEYVIDLTLSSGVIDQRNYNVAGAKRVPGLFYLRKTTTDGVWSVDRMSHAEIRASGNYDVGTVEYSAATLGNNYYQAKNWVCVSDNHTSVCTSATVSPASLAETSAKKNDTSSSLYYGLSYGTRNAATLTEYGVGNAADCLRENIGDNINGGANQVLVCHNGGSSIVYAISFAHGTSTNENVAQRVWRNVLLSPAADFTLSFYGVTDDDTAGAKVLAVNEDDLDKHTNWIEVSYATAKAWQNANPGKNPLQITGATAKVTWTGLIKDIPTTPVVDGMTYVVEVTRNDGVKEEPYYLIVDKASANAVLVDGDGVAHTDAAVKIPYNGIETTLENVLSKYTAGERGTLGEWTVRDAAGEVVKYGETSRWAAGYTAEVTVTPENGKAADAKTFTITFGNPVFDLDAAKAAATANLDKVDTTGLTADEVKPLKDKALADITAVTSTDKTTAEAQLKKIVDDYAAAVKAAQDAKDPNTITVTGTLKIRSVATSKDVPFTATNGKIDGTTGTVDVSKITCPTVKFTAKDVEMVSGGTKVSFESGILTFTPDGNPVVISITPNNDWTTIDEGGSGEGGETGGKPLDPSKPVGPDNPIIDYEAPAARLMTLSAGDAEYTADVDFVVPAQEGKEIVDVYFTGYDYVGHVVVDASHWHLWLDLVEGTANEDYRVKVVQKDAGTVTPPSEAEIKEAQAELDAYVASKNLTADQAAAIADVVAAQKEALAAVTDATKLADAVKAAEAKIQEAIDALPTPDPLAKARADAKAEIEAYKADEIEAMAKTDSGKNAAKDIASEKAKDLSFVADERATATETEIKAIVTAYKAFVDGKVPFIDDSVSFPGFYPSEVTYDTTNAKTEQTFTATSGMTIKKTTEDDDNGNSVTTLEVNKVPAVSTTAAQKMTPASSTLNSEVKTALNKKITINDTTDVVEATRFVVTGPANVEPTLSIPTTSNGDHTGDVYAYAYNAAGDVATLSATATVEWTVVVLVKVTVSSGTITNSSVTETNAMPKINISFANMTAEVDNALAKVDALLTNGVTAADVQEEYDALVTAIKACETPEALSTYYNTNNANLVTSNELVKAYTDAVNAAKETAAQAKDLADKKTAATKIVNDLISTSGVTVADVQTAYDAVIKKIDGATSTTIGNIITNKTDTTLVADLPEWVALKTAIENAKNSTIVVWAAPLSNRAADGNSAGTELMNDELTSSYSASYDKATNTINVVAKDVKVHLNNDSPRGAGYFAGPFIEAPSGFKTSTGAALEVNAYKLTWGDSYDGKTAYAVETDTLTNGHTGSKGVALYTNLAGDMSKFQTVTIEWGNNSGTATNGKFTDGTFTSLATVTANVSWDTSTQDLKETVYKANLNDTREDGSKIPTAEICSGYRVEATKSDMFSVDLDVYASELQAHKDAGFGGVAAWIGVGFEAPEGAGRCTIDVLNDSTYPENGKVNRRAGDKLNDTETNNAEEVEGTHPVGWAEYFKVTDALNGQAFTRQVQITWYFMDKDSETTPDANTPSFTMTYNVTFHVTLKAPETTVEGEGAGGAAGASLIDETFPVDNGPVDEF